MVGDLNRDNIDDLVISAPVYGSEGNYQQGRVYILYGKIKMVKCMQRFQMYIYM